MFCEQALVELKSPIREIRRDDAFNLGINPEPPITYLEIGGVRFRQSQPGLDQAEPAWFEPLAASYQQAAPAETVQESFALKAPQRGPCRRSARLKNPRDRRLAEYEPSRQGFVGDLLA